MTQPQTQLQSFKVSQTLTYMPGAEPYRHQGNRASCLLLHGFMASPGEVRWLGEYLAAQGHTVFAPCLPGHGIQPAEMLHVRWQDWLSAAVEGYHQLREQSQSVFIVGHSMGGLLGLLLAASHPVDGVAALATPIDFPIWRFWLTRYLKYAIPYTDQSDKTDLPEKIKREQGKRGEPILGRVRYDQWATSAVHELYALARQVRRKLPAVTAPLLLINSEKDTTTLPYQADRIARHVNSSTFERHMLKNSGHILTQDAEYEMVFALVGDFIQRLGSP